MAMSFNIPCANAEHERVKRALELAVRPLRAESEADAAHS